jgi:pyruvate formate-lyase/glycerol dehydratase family glycyl radical enzyme
MLETVLSPQEERISRGQVLTLTTEEARIKRARVSRMLDEIRNQPPRLIVERGRLLTKSFKETENSPLIIRWAKFLETVGNEYPIYICDNELVVGRCGPRGRYSVIYPEIQGCWVSPVEDMESRKREGFTITPEDTRLLNEEVTPYWAGKTLYEAWVKALPEDAKNLLIDEHDIYAPSMAIHCASALTSANAWIHDYEKVIQRGYSGLKKEAEEKLASLNIYNPDNNYDKMYFYQAIIIFCDAIIHYARRHAETARKMAAKEKNSARKKELLGIAEICERVPANPARSFREALQSLWFTIEFSDLEQYINNHAAPGRIDQYLYPYYKKDKEQGRITDDEVLELLECLWLNMAQSVRVQPKGMVAFREGYAHFEHTTIGGQTAEGKDATNELSYLVLQSKKEFPLDYPDLSVRIHSQTPQSFLLKVCELIKEGTGYPKLMNDEEIIPLYLAWGTSLEEARGYVGGGCIEPRILNRETHTATTTSISLGAVLEFALNNGKSRLTGEQIGVKTGDPRTFKSYQEIWKAFETQLEHVIKYALIAQYIANVIRAQRLVSPMTSCLHDLCMAQGLDLHQGQGKFKGDLSMGWVGNVGFGTVIDSLAAIKKLVFDDKLVTMDEMMEALRTDFQGKEALRQMCLNAPKYGNCDPYVDSIGYEIEKAMISMINRYTNPWGGFNRLIYVPITSHVALGRMMGATPNGRKAGEPMSEGISPSQGCDIKGPTATLLSIASTKNGAATRRAARLLNVKLSPQVVAGEEGTANLASFIRSWCDMKFWHIQFNIINRETLIEAKKHPDQYRNLLVRVAGYSAYFVDLSPDLQNEIIARTEHNFI